MSAVRGGGGELQLTRKGSVTMHSAVEILGSVPVTLILLCRDNDEQKY